VVKSDAWDTGWMITVLLVSAVIVIVFCLTPPMGEWNWVLVSGISTAIGTLLTTLAVLIALMFGRRELRWRNQSEAERRLHAILYAKSIVAAMGSSIPPMGQLTDLVGQWSGENDEPSQRIHDWLKILLEGFSAVDMNQLAIVDKKAATHFAIAQDQVHVLRLFFGPAGFRANQHQVVALRGMLQGNIDIATNSLSSTHNILRRITDQEIGRG
jgi:hypothetical protein